MTRRQSDAKLTGRCRGDAEHVVVTLQTEPSAPKDHFNPMTHSSESTFFAVLREAAEELIAMHDVAPRVVCYVASMQKWLITQAIVAFISSESTMKRVRL